jgi:hypothetical protein
MAWAIKLNSKNALDDQHDFAGVLFWLYNQANPIPACQDGLRVALFKTRRQAEQALPLVRRCFDHAVVKRVEITLTIH